MKSYQSLYQLSFLNKSSIMRVNLLIASVLILARTNNHSWILVCFAIPASICISLILLTNKISKVKKSINKLKSTQTCQRSINESSHYSFAIYSFIINFPLKKTLKELINFLVSVFLYFSKKFFWRYFLYRI